MDKKIFIVVLLVIINIVVPKNVYAETSDRVIKVGLFTLEPYAYVNSKGELDGYYVELFDLIAEKMNVKVEYVLDDMSNWLSNLENKKVDIILGASITKERMEKFIFNKQSIVLEKFALYTNNNEINFADFEEINGLKFGYVPENAKIEWVFNFFKAINIDVIPVVGKSYSELEKLMDDHKIDFMIDSSNSNNKNKKIYEFLGDQVYIAANKDAQSLLDEIDNIIMQYNNEDKNLISNLYKKYFDIEQKEIEKNILLLEIGIFIIFIIFVVIYIIPRLKKVLKQNKIRKRLKRDRYLLYYQPIYDPIKEIIVGFEALLRLKDKNNNLISPANFIPEIEKNNMLFDVTIWIMRRVVKDYRKISNYRVIKDNNFYISLNLSIDEIQNSMFVDMIIEILRKSKLQNQSICLEIVERVGIKDVHKIMKNIKRLKQAGFKIAIDDFGTEYSNLDVLERLDADIIKVDKKFIDGLGKHLIKDETILFILRVAEKGEKSVVLEGVEKKDQDKKIKSFNKKNVFVQGYFYNKPMDIQKIKALI